MQFIADLFGCFGIHRDLSIDDHHFKLLKKIGEGGFSQLFLIEELGGTKQKFALKQIDCYSISEVQRTQREIELHNKLRSKHHILDLQCYSETELLDRHRFSLVFPFYRHGSLYDELRTRRVSIDYIDEPRILRLFLQICTALSFLHALSPPIAHRDVKPGNILISDDDQAVLMDFGSCCECPIIINDSKQSRFMTDENAQLSSMAYRAPELFACDVGTILSESMDIWSLGCLLYALCFFHSPFDDVYERGDSIALAVQSEKIVYPDESQFSRNLYVMIKDLLKVDSTSRPKVFEVRSLVQSLTKIVE